MGPKLQEGSNEGLRIGKSNRNEQNEKSQLAERSFDLGHPDLLLLMKQRKHATPQRLLLGLALAFTDDRHVPSIGRMETVKR